MTAEPRKEDLASPVGVAVTNLDPQSAKARKIRTTSRTTASRPLPNQPPIRQRPEQACLSGVKIGPSTSAQSNIMTASIGPEWSRAVLLRTVRGTRSRHLAQCSLAPGTRSRHHSPVASLVGSTKRLTTSSRVSARIKDAEPGLAELINRMGSVSQSNFGPRTGLLGEALLSEPQSFTRIALQTKERAEELVQRIHEAGSGSFQELRNVVKMLDRLSDLLCKVIDLAEFIRTAHPEPAWTHAADDAHQFLCNFMNVLNTDTRLYQVRLLPGQELSSVLC